MLNIHFFGKSRMYYSDEAACDQLGTKAYALIALLVLNEHRHLSREKIIGYLWPDSNEDAARYNLRYNLWLIKKNIKVDGQGNPFLLVDKETCAINPAYPFRSDILEIINFSPSDEDDIDQLLLLKSLFQGEFLEGCYFNKCDSFNEWIIFERINFEKRKVKILKRLVALYEASGDLDACLDTIQDIMEIEPYDEAMVEKTLDIYAMCGNRTAAITYYNWFSNQLAGSLGVGPSESLKAKYNELRTQVAQRQDSACATTCNGEHCLKCSEHDGIVRKQDKPIVMLMTYCLETIPFYWMASFLESVTQQLDREILQLLEPLEIVALSSIQPQLAYLYESMDERSLSVSVREAGVVSAFIRLVGQMGLKYRIQLTIADEDAMDLHSADIYKYIMTVHADCFI
ncbi:MAG: hypothetical protein JXO44_03025 [Clostridia bacterium]|nr:hypothetical protein [Clostridia bacterium]